MKNQSEKQPIDDLFARKLGNMSLPPSADGFERLQARMGKRIPEARVVFWQNPTIQRYMAAAACLILVGLFGWLYRPVGTAPTGGENQVATNTPHNQTGRQKLRPKTGITQKAEESQATSEGKKATELSLPTQEEQIALVEKSAVRVKQADRSVRQPVKDYKPSTKRIPSTTQEPVLAQNKPVEAPTKQDVNTTPSIEKPTVPEQVADVKPTTKPTAPAERVLVVTIAEPEALVAARQAAKASGEEKATVASTEKQEKDPKATGLWQQVKRFKEGELFARRDNDNSSSEDRGLLGRAYSGLKHSLDKDKSSKQ
ncbi:MULTISPECIES: hypothetical protein [unclassified Spirosoma]|uniref:hypothetical protein n=1 Tax=unclassified Spirosoma TaxID=2621999 RepID=UPI00095A2F0E|nr:MULTISPECIES: hypothetical protein [unclassified Spirosoma]MBN8822863.1 hypothetical protein [Spirosoma sp.]OJW80057.1 MAG: hypothetical protein BGO59_02290 [Spirosoma sp. 48-14]